MRNLAIAQQRALQSLTGGELGQAKGFLRTRGLRAGGEGEAQHSGSAGLPSCAAHSGAAAERNRHPGGERRGKMHEADEGRGALPPSDPRHYSPPGEVLPRTLIELPWMRG